MLLKEIWDTATRKGEQFVKEAGDYDPRDASSRPPWQPPPPGGSWDRSKPTSRTPEPTPFSLSAGTVPDALRPEQQAMAEADAASFSVIREKAGSLTDSLRRAVDEAQEATRRDFAGYEELRSRQALPTLLEEVSPDLPPLPPLALPEALPSLPSMPIVGETLGAKLGGGGGKLRAFAAPSGDAVEQRRLIQQRYHHFDRRTLPPRHLSCSLSLSL